MSPQPFSIKSAQKQSSDIQMESIPVKRYHNRTTSSSRHTAPGINPFPFAPVNTDEPVIKKAAITPNLNRVKDKENLYDRIRQFADGERFKDAKKNNDELLAQIRQLTAERDSYKKKYEEASTASTKVNKNLVEKIQQNAQRDSEIEELKKANAEADKTIADLKGQLEKAKIDLRQKEALVYSEFGAKIVAMQQTLAEQKQTNKDLLEQLGHLRLLNHR